MSKTDPERIEFTLDDGAQVIVLETAAGRQAEGYKPVSRGSRGPVTERASRSFAEVIRTLKPVLDTIRTELAETIASADELSISLGVKIGADAGVMLASVSSEATINVSVKWKRGDAPKPKPKPEPS